MGSNADPWEQNRPGGSRPHLRNGRSATVRAQREAMIRHAREPDSSILEELKMIERHLASQGHILVALAVAIGLLIAMIVSLYLR